MLRRRVDLQLPSQSQVVFLVDGGAGQGLESDAPSLEDYNVGLARYDGPGRRRSAVALTAELRLVEAGDLELAFSTVIGQLVEEFGCKLFIVSARLAARTVEFVVWVFVALRDKIVMGFVEIVERDGNGIEIVLSGENVDNFG